MLRISPKSLTGVSGDRTLLQDPAVTERFLDGLLRQAEISAVTSEKRAPTFTLYSFTSSSELV